MRVVPSLVVIAASIAPAVPVFADEPPAAGRRIAVVAGPVVIPKGARCRVEVKPEPRGAGGVETTYEGKVVAADDEGLTLAVSATRRREVYDAEAAKLPLFGRLFTNLGVAMAKPGEEKEVRIPAAKIQGADVLRD